MSNARSLANHLATILSRERDAMAEFLVALAAFDRQQAWADLGYSSLFWFLHRELGLSRGAAHDRKMAAELVREHPEVVAPLRDGSLCLSTVVELAKVIEAGLDLLLARHRERRGIGAKPARNGRGAAPGRIRAEVKREV